VCSPVLLGEFYSDVVASDGKATILSLIGPRRVGGLEELDEGEALDGAEVGRGLIHVLGDIDVLDGSILLEHSAQLLDTDVAGQVACDHGLYARSVGRYYRGDRDLLDDGALGELDTSAVGADGENVRLALLRADAGSAGAGLVVKDSRDVAPGHSTVPQGFHDGIIEPHRRKGAGEVIGRISALRRRRLGNCGHLRSWRGLEGLGRLGRLGKLG